MDFKYLISNRLRLRIVDELVMKYVHEHYNDVELMDFFGLQNAEELQTAKERYRGRISTFDRKSIKFILINESNKVIGDCGFHNWYLRHRRAELGYSLFNEDVKRKGYMTEALEVIVDYGFNEMNLHRIEAMIGTENIASQRLVNRLGFQLEGKLREHYYTNNRMEDSLVFGLLRDEYKPLSNEKHKKI